MENINNSQAQEMSQIKRAFVNVCANFACLFDDDGLKHPLKDKYQLQCFYAATDELASLIKNAKDKAGV